MSFFLAITEVRSLRNDLQSITFLKYVFLSYDAISSRVLNCWHGSSS